MLLTPGCSRDPGGIAQCEPSRWTYQVTILSGKREAQRHADGTGPNDRDGRRRPPTRACTHKSRIVSKLNPFRYPADCRLKPDIASGPFGANKRHAPLEFPQFGVYLQDIWRTACRRSNILVVGPFHPWLLHSPVRWAAPSSQPQNQHSPTRRKTALVRFSPQQVQTPSFTAQKMAIPFPTLGKRGGKAALGSQDTVSVHLPTSTESILHGSSSDL